MVIANTTAAPLVIRFGALGDMVLLTVLLRILQQRYGQPCDILSSGGWSRDLLAGHPDVGNISLLSSRTRPYWSDPAQWALVRALRDRPPGPIYVCDGAKQDKLRWWLARADIPGERILCYQPAGAEPEPWVGRWQRFGQDQPAAYRDLPAARAVPDHPLLHVQPAARRELEAFLSARGISGRLWLLQPGSKRTLKRGRLAALDDDKWWPVERWVQVARQLLADGRADHVLLCGAPREQRLLQQIAAQAGDARVHALGDALRLPRLLALCERAVGMASIDTGPAHVAVALGCPAVVLFGRADPALWAPSGPAGTEVISLRQASDSPRVAGLDAEQVIDACRRLAVRVAKQG